MLNSFKNPIYGYKITCVTSKVTVIVFLTTISSKNRCFDGKSATKLKSSSSLIFFYLFLQQINTASASVPYSQQPSHRTRGKYKSWF